MTSLGSCIWVAPEDGRRAVDLYTSVVPDCRVVEEQVFTNDDQPGGEVRMWSLDVAGRTLQVMCPSGAERSTTAHSLWLVVDDQAAIDQVWDGFLQAGGSEMACGWIVDPFGLHWQVLPAAWERLTSGDPARAQRVVEALWQMTRIDVAGLEAAAEGG